MKPKGWKNEPGRHSLASLGIKTGRKQHLVLSNARAINIPIRNNQDIVALGNDVSGGFGFWGHSILQDPYKRSTAIRAFIDGLREKGLSGIDIALYGDWRTARHIADRMQDYRGYDAMKNVVKFMSESPSEIRKENLSAYRDYLNGRIWEPIKIKKRK